ncbi:hypothetical protein [Nitratireductor soli]|uniref:hypothetical protein n=1 Tax=Nitratireductor soli TaxID=1670619 RepID=UPI00065E136A|nr:hypothetical protein [Nitratireductor soli]
MDFDQLPQAESYRRIDFDVAEVKEQDGIKLLVVSGEAPCANMEVTLSPLIYIEKPDHWGIEVVGHLDGGICLTAIKPYTVSIRLDGIVGHKGIEVIGASRKKRIDI